MPCKYKQLVSQGGSASLITVDFFFEFIHATENILLQYCYCCFPYNVFRLSRYMDVRNLEESRALRLTKLSMVIAPSWRSLSCPVSSSSPLLKNRSNRVDMEFRHRALWCRQTACFRFSVFTIICSFWWHIQTHILAARIKGPHILERASQLCSSISYASLWFSTPSRRGRW